ncbi:MAG: hypothetical protein ACR2L1_05475 [Pyrinomonadaceae bacterium]
MNYFNYFSEIEETFNRRRGKHLFLSPLDWAMIETWQQRGVPLHVVLRGIEKVFDGIDAKAPRRRSVKSLMYCREEIEAQHEEWLERQIGNNDGAEGEQSESMAANSDFSREAILEHLETSGAQITKAVAKAKGELSETLARVSGRLDELKTTFADAETLEDALTDLEKLIDAALLSEASDSAAKTGIEKQLASYKSKMDAEAYRQTFELMFLKRLREDARIPRLSLFYL